jgi:3-isopropylmalate/(R)-2-methylmalate dehydratase large subunit
MTTLKPNASDAIWAKGMHLMPNNAMGLTFTQKIIAKKAGLDTVEIGRIVNASSDVLMSHDNTAAISQTFAEIGVERVFDPDRHVIVLDHCAPAANEAHATNHRIVREFVARQGIRHFYDIGNGICHQVLAEKGHVRPGHLIVGADSHTTTYGALGALGIPIGRSEMAAVWATGELWLRVPETTKIRLEGRLPSGVYAKDAILHVIGDLGADGATYEALEFDGEVVRSFTVDDRLTLCNMAIEMGAKSGYVPPDALTAEWLAGIGVTGYDPVRRTLTYDLSGLEPQVARPHSVDNVAPVSQVAGTRIDQAVVGTCTNGRLTDLHTTAQILRGGRVAAGVRLLVVPASRDIFRRALADGTILTLTEAGAIVCNPNCGPCMGTHQGVLAPGEVCIASTNRNFRGRMGCRDAEIYLASPATVAASALAGCIADPRDRLP